MVLAVVVVGPANEKLQEEADLQAPAESLEETETSKVSKAASSKAKMNCRGLSAYRTNLLNRFVKRPHCIDQTRYS